MKNHVLPAERHDDDDDCPEEEPPMEITGSGGVVIEVGALGLPFVVIEEDGEE